MKDSYWSDKRVFVTGYEGFLGSWLTKVLIEKGARVIGLDNARQRPLSILEGWRRKIKGIKGSVVSYRLINRIFEKYRPEIVFHLAAQSIVGLAKRYPLKALRVNVLGTANLLEAARNMDCLEAMVVASSDKAYGSHRRLPYRETTPLKGEYPYDVSKASADLICRAYFKTFKVPVGVTRCGNIYGPGDFHFSRIVPDAIRKALANEVFLIRSDGRFTRDYVFVSDIVSGYLLLARLMKKKHLAGGAFNFSNGKPVSVLTLVKKIYRLCQQEPKYKILNQAKSEIRHQYLEAAKARRILSWRPEYGLTRGLKETIAWYRIHF
ncbi:MAG: GDP-mannose 4,6-dehydratase [Candidatus Pacebacteria bacterium]|nr:GDP-mannose 4,6-dehydratase [Candidatus Paceibacterota bacterium]